MNKWTPEQNQMILRRVGKTGEEAAELMKVTSRIVIQGIDGIDPATGKTNRQALTEEIADVIAQAKVTVDALGLDNDAIMARAARKEQQMHEWEALFNEEGA